MKKLIPFLLLLVACDAFGDASILFNLTDFAQSPATNRTVWVTPMSVPTVGASSIVIGGRYITNSGTGTFVISNAAPGLYLVQIQAPPQQTAFKVAILTTDTGTISARSNTVADSTATFPAGSVGWSTASADLRYAPISSTGPSVAAGTNLVTTTNGSVVTPSLVAVPSFDGSAISNITMLDTTVGTRTIGSGFVLTFNGSTASQTLTEVPATATLGFTGHFTANTNISTTSGQFAGNGAGLSNIPPSSITGAVAVASNTVSATLTNLQRWSVKEFGAVGDGKVINTGTMTSNSATLTVTGSPFTSSDVGKAITVYGAGRKPSGFTTTNQALNLTGVILSTNSANIVVLSTNCQQDITSARVVYGTDDTAAINKGLHYVCTNNSGAGGTLFFPQGIYIVDAAPFDTNMTGLNLGGLGGFHEPKNAQIYFPDPPGWSVVLPVQQIPVIVKGPVPAFYNQGFQNVDMLWTNRGAVIWSTRADLNGASVISCIATSQPSSCYENFSYRFWDAIGAGTNRFYALPYHVEFDEITIRTTANPTGPALNLCGAGTMKLDGALIDSGYPIYNNRGKPMNTNGYGLIGPTPSSSGPAFLQNSTICGFYTALLMPEHCIANGLYLFSSLYAIESSSGHAVIGNFDIEDCGARINNRNHAYSWWNDVSMIGENVNAAGVWSYPGVLVTNDTTCAMAGLLLVNNSTYGTADMPVDFGTLAGTEPALQILNLGGNGVRPHYYTNAARPQFATMRADVVGVNFIGLADYNGTHGAYPLKTGDNPFMWIDGSACDGGVGAVNALWQNNGHNWRFGLGGSPFNFSFFNYTLGQNILALSESGNASVASNVIAGGQFMAANITAALPLVANTDHGITNAGSMTGLTYSGGNLSTGRLTNHTDVNGTPLSTGALLQWNGSQWVQIPTNSFGGGSTTGVWNTNGNSDIPQTGDAGGRFLGTRSDDNAPVIIKRHGINVFQSYDAGFDIPDVVLGNNAGSGNAIGNSVGGGYGNLVGVTSAYDHIGGGLSNHIGIASTTSYSVIGGGRENAIQDNAGSEACIYSVIAGGYQNTNRSGFATFISGGYSNQIGNAANYSWAGGFRANVQSQGAFVWSDNTSGPYSDNGAGSFNVRAAGGEYFTGLLNAQAGALITGTLTATTPVFYGYLDSVTNTWATNTAFPLGFTNLVAALSVNAAGGITGVANGPTSTYRWGQMTIIASGDVVFTNPAAIHSSDFVTTRTITNGNTADIAIEVIPGKTTNMAIVQFK